jgi:hypothetical protein
VKIMPFKKTNEKAGKYYPNEVFEQKTGGYKN